jgi:hypothetical protein
MSNIDGTYLLRYRRHYNDQWETELVSTGIRRAYYRATDIEDVLHVHPNFELQIHEVTGEGWNLKYTYGKQEALSSGVAELQYAS